jgi:hypothetical protein
MRILKKKYLHNKYEKEKRERKTILYLHWPMVTVSPSLMVAKAGEQ